MEPIFILLILCGYFAILLLISHFTSRKTDAETYFTANRGSVWYVVAFGMIGSSLSGITFISVPGMVGNENFYYFQLVLGYLLGYGIIAGVLLPLYYKLNLVSIYGYLGQRIGEYSHKTGSLFFLISQSIGAALRLFVVAEVLQRTLFDHFHVPFAVTVIVVLVMIWIYTRKAGIKTIVWTDIFQTTIMITAIIGVLLIVINQLGISFFQAGQVVYDHNYSTVFNWDWQHEKYFWKQFITGVLVAVAMNGLDQNEMQKSLTCSNLKDAQKNITLYSVILVATNLLFLSFGVLLYVYVEDKGISLPQTVSGAFKDTDALFSFLSMQQLGGIAGFLFILGIASAAFSSADSALASLTTAFYKDFIREDNKSEEEKIKTRKWINVMISIFLISLILLFRAINNESVIHLVFTIAGYTYGPLLGMFAFGLFTKWETKDKWVPIIAVLSSVASYILSTHAVQWFGINLGYTVLLLNGMITFTTMALIKK
ncbi:MAG: sodium:solute symporter [Cyclobacteriaceae bacterium]|nr:sodium:solute symporter [Cyclobacteriaceae bacterium]